MNLVYSTKFLYKIIHDRGSDLSFTTTGCSEQETIMYTDIVCDSSSLSQVSVILFFNVT